ncbi:hypothetical protein RD792_012348 [Penstemon davidsonii]|uniref:J domain-containing protein n=1 Tax=Penstemon davidsonii TaxID=160366 RepID=A0ABR0CXG6_9LAMI|nr:hypothetical protein RD792_012348 [Penstemon davidsonii]
MESLSRPPHRRKHSSATNAFSSSFSLKNPYDDVLLSKGGGNTKSFGVREYSEIFSGSSSSIPVLDLSGLDEGDCRSSAKLDYSNIFGGFRNDDVAVPYEQLFNGSPKQTKQRFPADARSPLQESGSPEKTKRSSEEASDQSVDGVKKQFNLSFNKISQINNDKSNGKTHVAQLHAVPGFTYFVDGTPKPQKTEEDKPVTSLKREVSRTWSFSADLEAVKTKGGLNLDRSHIPDKSHNLNENNLKTHPSKVSPVSSRLPSLNDSMEFRRSRASSFSSKEEASGKISDDEELDENSAAAISAAALKKAIEQAQESIRIAKMIMERKTEGFQDGTKPRSKGRSKGKDKKETRIEHEAYGSKDNNARENSGRSSVFPTSTLGHTDKLNNVRKSEVEKVRESDEEAKEHREPFIEVAEHYGEKVEFEKKKGFKNNNLMLSTSKPASPPVEMENGKKTLEHGDVTLHHTKGPEVVIELAEKALSTPQVVAEPEKSVTGTSDQSQATVILSKVSNIVTGLVERVLNTSLMTQEPEKIVDVECKGKENEVIEERENATVDEEKLDKEEHDKNFQESEEIVNNLLNEPQNLAEKEVLEQEYMMKKSENVSDWKEIDQRHGKSYDGEEKETRQIEPPLWFESEEQLKEDMEEETKERDPEVFPETREVERKVDETHELEIDDKKLDLNHHGDEQNEPIKLEQIEERDMNTFEYEATETHTIETEGNNSDEGKKAAVFQDAEAKEPNNSLRGEGSEETQNKCDFEEAAYKKDINEATDANSDDACTIVFETQESCDVDFNNRGEEHQKDDGSVPKVLETFSAIDKVKTAEQLFDLGDTEIPAADCLRKSASEENFVGSKLYNTFDGLSSDEKEDNVGVMDPDQEEKLPKDEEDNFKTADENHDRSEEYAASATEVNPSDNKTAEFDIVDEIHGSEQTSASDEESLSTSSLENVDDLSAHESPDSEENAKDQTSDKEEVKGDLEMTSTESKFVEEQDAVYSQEQREFKVMEESTETERAVETFQNIEKNKENLTEASTTEEKDAKENMHNFDKNDHQQRIEAIKKGREREKDRIAVERAIREARERAFAEARERAERAAVERAAAEARQRAMAEAKEKLEKANAEAKIRAGRAAVERATTEARERALEKAMSHKTSNEVKTQTASSSRNIGLKHSFSSSDIEKIDGTNTESAQRQKARLERHQRIMERAAKALAEKNMRDLIVQKEQAERNRLSESLDADIKRWASGKEGNLRALLSTLQYILGSESGWKPISLTEILTTAAVKKAYRKATLYVHPDKLQQRGASIQQKYICEKVFDLLKFKVSAEDEFIKTDGEHFLLNGSPFYANGFNAYWLMYVASDSSQRNKITCAFQGAANHGLTIARTWAFSDGGYIYAPLQYSPGFFNEQMSQAQFDHGHNHQQQSSKKDPIVKPNFNRVLVHKRSDPMRVAGSRLPDCTHAFSQSLVRKRRAKKLSE